MSEEIQNEVTDTDATETPSSEGQTPDGAFADLLQGIREGERQKYDSVESALKSITPAQEHIKRLEDENAQMKERLQEAKTVEDLMSRLNESPNSQDNQPQEQAAFDVNKLKEFVHAELSQTQKDQIAKENVSVVMKAFKDKYGDKAPEVYNQMAAEAGISGDFLRSLAETSPKAVLKLAGLESSKEHIPSKIESGVRSEGLGTAQPNPSARVPMVGASSEALANAWKATAAVYNS